MGVAHSTTVIGRCVLTAFVERYSRETCTLISPICHDYRSDPYLVEAVEPHRVMVCIRLYTKRLELVAATAELIRVEMNHPSGLCRCLNAHIPMSWPPKLIGNMIGPIFADRLEEYPRLVGWSYWYWVLDVNEMGIRYLIGRSYFNEPTRDGTVEIGYEVLDEFQASGYATEAVRTLVAWAFSHPSVSRVIADAYPPASIRVLEKNGFTIASDGSRCNMVRFELTRSCFLSLCPHDPLTAEIQYGRDIEAMEVRPPWWKRLFCR